MFAFDSTTNLPKTGDAANLTAYVDKDDAGVNVLADTSATEKDSTNAKGYYIFDLAQAETNGDKLLFSAKSSTANIVVIAVPAVIYTTPASFTSFTTPPTTAQIATAVWTDTTAGDFTVANSIGKSIMNGVSLGTGLTIAAVSGAVGSVTALGAGAVASIWDALLSGITTASSIGKLIKDNLDAAISSRMATYTQPTGFLAATFPTTVASTTNITAATGIDVTKLNGTSIAGTGTRVADSFVTLLNVASPVFTVASVNQTGDSYARIGATGSGLSSLAPASTALSTAQWTSARAGYLDNINNAALATTVAQTGDSYAIVSNSTYGNSALKSFFFQAIISYGGHR